MSDTFTDIVQSIKATDNLNIELIVRQEVNAAIENRNKTLLKDLRSMLEKKDLVLTKRAIH